MPDYPKMAFVLHALVVITYLPEHVVTQFNDVYSLKKHEVVFLQYAFCFKLNIFSKIANFLLSMGVTNVDTLLKASV